MNQKEKAELNEVMQALPNIGLNYAKALLATIQEQETFADTYTDHAKQCEGRILLRLKNLITK